VVGNSKLREKEREKSFAFRGTCCGVEIIR